MSCKSPLILLLFALTALSGCAEGTFWKMGQYSPWAREQWSEEEKIADTLFKRKRELNARVEQVSGMAATSQEPVAKELLQVIQQDPVLLIRLHAVKLLGNLSCPSAYSGLEQASRDGTSDVRIAAIRSVESLSGEIAIPILQNILGSDTNIDVRLAATRALGNFPGERTIRVLTTALRDNDPALQVRATESLERVTGESLGPDVLAWQQYVDQYLQDSAETNPASTPDASDSLRSADNGGDFRSSPK